MSTSTSEQEWTATFTGTEPVRDSVQIAITFRSEEVIGRANLAHTWIPRSMSSKHMAYMLLINHRLEFNLVFQHGSFQHLTSVSMIRRLSNRDNTSDH